MPWDNDPGNWAALITGSLLMVLGVIPLLAKWGVLSLKIPTFLSSNIFMSIGTYIIAIAGIYILINSFMEDDTMRMISIGVAILVILIGIIPILTQFGVIKYEIPFLSPLFFYIMFTIEGFFLFLAAFMIQ